MIADLLAETLVGFIPWPQGRAGLMLAWLATVGCALLALYTFLHHVPRAPEVLAACATVLVCLLVMGPILRKSSGLPPWW